MDTSLGLVASFKDPSDGCSEVVDDPNALILLGRKKKKQKCSVQVKPEKGDPKSSKSQQRKLKQLQEEKAKRARLAESYQTLQKHKLQDDAYGLLYSSRNISQVETMKEKLRRAMQLSRAGLEVPPDAPLLRKRNIAELSYLDTESDIKMNHQDAHRPCLQEPSKHLNDELKLPLLENYQMQGSVNRETACTDSSLPLHCSSDACLAVNASSESDVCSNGLNREEGASTQNETISAHPQGQKSFTVHVVRPAEVEEKRVNLPIVMMEQEIMEAINEHAVVVICGETGCGKTTQVPQFLYEAGFGSKECIGKGGIIGVTQPRRVAVLATAKRVSYELGLKLGKGVGFQVRHDKKMGDCSSIKFMTDGILLREVQSDVLLKRYSIILLDEAHERSLNTDILIGMLSRIIQLRQELYEDQQQKILTGIKITPDNIIYPLKLVLMSATLKVEDFISNTKLFHVPPPVIEVPTRQFPVTTHFSRKTELIDYVGEAYKKVLMIHRRLPPGGILVFLTGQREVDYLCSKLRKMSSLFKKKCARCTTDDGNADGSTLGVSMHDDEFRDIREAFETSDEPTREQEYGANIYEEEEPRDPILHSDSSDIESDEMHNSDDDVSSEDLVSKGDTDSLKDILGHPESIASLKAAFAALAGNVQVTDPKDDTVPSHSSAGDELGISGNNMKATVVSPMYVLPLYAMLPSASQLRVFGDVPEGQRLVVVATNVAETSLTIPGIKYVVDSGREKVKNYNCVTGMANYEVQWISKASAAQRAGRAGRTGPGHCYRLYSSAVFSNTFDEFSVPEILKTPVEGVLLLMKFMGIFKVVNFPFPTPPEGAALAEAERCLRVLEALDHCGKPTHIGKAMAQYPISPRHSRMLLTVIGQLRHCEPTRANLVLGYAVAAAAAMSSDKPFVFQFDARGGSKEDMDQVNKDKVDNEPHEISARIEKDGTAQHAKLSRGRQKALVKEVRAKFCNPSSDALTVAYALLHFELAESPMDFCTKNLLHFKTMDEMSKLRKQLLWLIFHHGATGSQLEFSWTNGDLNSIEGAWKSAIQKPLSLNEEELLGQAICAGWADRIAQRVRKVSDESDGKKKSSSLKYQASMLSETVYLHRGSAVARSAPQFVVYTELVNSSRPYMHGITSVKAEWLIKHAKPLCTFSEPLSDPKPYYEPTSDQVMCWVTTTFGPHLWQLPLHSRPCDKAKLRVSVFACALLEGKVLPCVKSMQKYFSAAPSNILIPEAAGQKRIGNLLNTLRNGSAPIDSRAKLRETWRQDPNFLHYEIKSWFQEKYHDYFEQVWEQMHCEVMFDTDQLFRKRIKRAK